MTISAWEPTPTSDSFNIDTDVLSTFIALSENDQLEQISLHLDQTLVSKQTPLMKLGKVKWFAAAEALDNEQLIHLIRFFTKAEQQLSGWEAGAESPVIWLVKVLRQRKSPPSKELLLWIRGNSDNRFLPNGAL